MKAYLQSYGIGFAAAIGLLAFVIGITNPHGEASILAGGVWFGSALVAAQIASLGASTKRQ